MFKRIGTFMESFGVAVLGGMLLFLVFDFASQLNTPIIGFADLLNAMQGIQYIMVVVLTAMVIAIPVDWYFFVGGTTAARDVPIWMPLELMLFFGLIGLVVGFNSSKKGVKDAIISSYMFVFIFNLILLIIIFFTYDWFIGMILMAVIEGAYGRDLYMFVVLSVLENGTILAIFSSFVTAILEDEQESGLGEAICANGDLCKVEL